MRKYRRKRRDVYCRIARRALIRQLLLFPCPATHTVIVLHKNISEFIYFYLAQLIVVLHKIILITLIIRLVLAQSGLQCGWYSVVVSTDDKPRKKTQGANAYNKQQSPNFNRNSAFHTKLQINNETV